MPSSCLNHAAQRSSPHALKQTGGGGFASASSIRPPPAGGSGVLNQPAGQKPYQKPDKPSFGFSQAGYARYRRPARRLPFWSRFLAVLFPGRFPGRFPAAFSSKSRPKSAPKAVFLPSFSPSRFPLLFRPPKSAPKPFFGPFRSGRIL